MLIRGTRLIEGVLIQFFPNRDEIGSGFSVIYGVCQSLRRILSLKELRNRTPLVGLGMLHEVSSALAN